MHVPVTACNCSHKLLIFTTRYQFRILDATGWNFRHAFYHEENRRTLVKAYGLKFLLVIDGRAGKFDLKNTVIVLVTGLGLLGLSTMFCDFVLLNYSPERKKVSNSERKERKCTVLEKIQWKEIKVDGGGGGRGNVNKRRRLREGGGEEEKEEKRSLFVSSLQDATDFPKRQVTGDCVFTHFKKLCKKSPRFYVAFSF